MVSRSSMSCHFLSTLSLRRATHTPRSVAPLQGLSIHALLAESDLLVTSCMPVSGGFLSTLSLRRATRPSSKTGRHFRSFYPRSPCGERPAGNKAGAESFNFLSTLSLRRATLRVAVPEHVIVLSIHALLAESDTHWLTKRRLKSFFLSTLSLRRATSIFKYIVFCSFFLSTLSLRRATGNPRKKP